MAWSHTAHQAEAGQEKATGTPAVASKLQEMQEAQGGRLVSGGRAHPMRVQWVKGPVSVVAMATLVPHFERDIVQQSQLGVELRCRAGTQGYVIGR